MAVTGAVLRSAFIQYSRILAKQSIRPGFKELACLNQNGSCATSFQLSKNYISGSGRCFSTSSISDATSPVTELSSQQEWSLASTSSLSKDIINNIDTKLESEDLGRLFAVVQVGGKQRKVTTEDILVVEHFFPPTVGDKIRLEKVLMVGSKDFTLIGRPILSREQVYIEATVIEKTLSHFKAIFHYFARKGHRKFNLKRSPQTMLVINNIWVKQLTS